MNDQAIHFVLKSKKICILFTCIMVQSTVNDGINCIAPKSMKISRQANFENAKIIIFPHLLWTYLP